MKRWEGLEEHIVQKLKEIDPYCKRQKGSGNGICKGDVKTSLPIHLEAKYRSTKDITIRMDVWEKTKNEIPVHKFDTLPIYALEQKDGKRFACLDLDDFLEIYIEYYKSKEK